MLIPQLDAGIDATEEGLPNAGGSQKIPENGYFFRS